MEQNRKNRKKAGGGAWAVFLILALSAVRGIQDPAIISYVFAGLFILGGVVLVISAIRKKAKAGAGSAPDRSAARPAPRSAGSTVPYRPAAVPLSTTDGEGNSDRDRQRRREQLDTFLRNGIIDRKEYAALLLRHEGKR